MHSEADQEGSSSEDDLDLGLVAAKKDPISEEKQRHKENLMQDIYDQLSDEEDEDEESKTKDNPFQKQLEQEAKQLKAQQAS